MQFCEVLEEGLCEVQDFSPGIVTGIVLKNGVVQLFQGGLTDHPACVFPENIGGFDNPLVGFWGDFLCPRGCITLEFVPDKGQVQIGQCSNLIIYKRGHYWVIGLVV